MEDNINSILIVEDEAAVRRGLRKKINWEELNLSIAGEAQNSEEAYEIIKITPPDIILLDMRMPGIGGMKLLEILSEQFPSIKVIILSGHSDFEYMRQALKCGASDYLLKPIIKEDLKAALIKVINSITEERKSKNEKMHQNIILNESIPLLKASLLNKILFGLNLGSLDIIKRLSYLNISLDYKFFVVAVIRIANFDLLKSTYLNDTSLAFFALENVIAESIGDFKGSIGFKNSSTENEFIYIFGFNDKENIKSRLTDIFEMVVANIEKYNKLVINVSISDVCDTLTDIPKVYKKASHIWGKKKSEEEWSILFSEDFYDEDQLTNLITFTEIMEITSFIKENDKQKLMNVMSGIFHRIENFEGAHLEIYQKITAKIYFCFEKILEEYSFNTNSIFSERILTYNNLVTKYNSPDEIRNGIIRVAVEVSDLLAKRRKLESNSIIVKATEYINSYFFEDISLEFISKKFFLNSTYFCELFKKEIGYSFNKYLNKIRIEKAKELLGNQDVKPTDVAELVGFKELSYFCSVFKKFEGMTPSEFKKAAVSGPY